MIHEIVDIDRWRAVFPVPALREEARNFVISRQGADPSQYPDQKDVDKHIALMSPSARAVTSPYDIAVLEQLREEVRSEGKLSESNAVPTDVFVFSKGEAPNREVTKIGGLPYWPRKKRWPSRGKWPFFRKPLDFIGQICFADSTDICGELPGDILLIFGDLQRVESGENDALTFFWQNLDLTDLVHPSDVPKSTRQMTPCYGSIYRTQDYDGFLDEDGFIKSRDEYDLAVIEGTKIGGLPHWAQYSDDLGGRFIAALGSIQPKPKRPFPWLNVPNPIESFTDAYDENALMWGDAGSVYLSIDSNGVTHWLEQCY